MPKQVCSLFSLKLSLITLHTGARVIQHRANVENIPLWSEGFSTGAVMRKVGFSDSSVGKTGLSSRHFSHSTLTFFAMKKVRVLWPKCRLDKPVFHTLESENPTFLIYLYIIYSLFFVIRVDYHGAFVSNTHTHTHVERRSTKPILNTPM